MPSSDNKAMQDLEAEIKILRETLRIKEKQLANLKVNKTNNKVYVL